MLMDAYLLEVSDIHSYFLFSCLVIIADFDKVDFHVITLLHYFRYCVATLLYLLL